MNSIETRLDSSQHLCGRDTVSNKSVLTSGDAAGMSACATSYPTDVCEKCRLPAGGAKIAEEGTAFALLAFRQWKIEFGLRFLKVPNGLFGTVD